MTSSWKIDNGHRRQKVTHVRRLDEYLKLWVSEGNVLVGATVGDPMFTLTVTPDGEIEGELSVRFCSWMIHAFQIYGLLDLAARLPLSAPVEALTPWGYPVWYGLPFLLQEAHFSLLQHVKNISKYRYLYLYTFPYKYVCLNLAVGTHKSDSHTVV